MRNSSSGQTVPRAGGKRIGQIEIHRVLEMVMPFDRRAFFPHTSDEDWAPHRSWLEPDALDDQIRLESTPGHTPVQCLHPEWVPWPDWDAELASRTRRAFLERHCDTPTLVCTAHFPLPSAGRVVRAGNAFRFVYDDRPWSSAHGA